MSSIGLRGRLGQCLPHIESTALEGDVVVSGVVAQPWRVHVDPAFAYDVWNGRHARNGNGPRSDLFTAAVLPGIRVKECPTGSLLEQTTVADFRHDLAAPTRGLFIQP